MQLVITTNKQKNNSQKSVTFYNFDKYIVFYFIIFLCKGAQWVISMYKHRVVKLCAVKFLSPEG
jgi:hypothetical protein